MEQKNIYKWDDGNGVEIGKKTQIIMIIQVKCLEFSGPKSEHGL